MPAPSFIGRMADVIVGLEADLEEAKGAMRSSSNAHASAAKALVRLRTGRENFIALIEHARKANQEGSATVTKHGDETTSDLLSPLLLLLSHKDVPSVAICASLSSVQRLAQSSLLTPADGENIAHALESIVTRRENAVDYKTLQTCAVLMRSTGGSSVDVCRRMVNLASSLADENRTKELAVRKAAIGCLIQISSAVFEKASSPSPASEDLETAKRLLEEMCAVPEKNDSSSAARAGMGLMQNVAMFARSAAAAAAASATSSRGRPSSLSSADDVWIEPNRICNKDAVEIIDSILSDNPSALRTRPEIAGLVKTKCGPIVLNLLRGKYRESTNSGGYGWPLMVRLMRATKSLLVLREICGETLTLSLFTELVSMLETENSEVIVIPPWHYVLTLETVFAAFSSPGFLPYLFSASVPLSQRTVEALSKLIQSWSTAPHDWAEIDQAAREAELSKGDTLQRKARSRGLELLGDVEPPVSFQGPMVVLVSVECLVAALADGGLKDTPTIRVGGLLRKTSQQSSREDEEIDVAVRKSVLLATWRPCLAAFSCLLAGCQEEGMVQYILRAYLSLTTSCGAAELVEARDAFISSMCKFALPTNFTSYSSALTSFHSTMDGTQSQQVLFRSTSGTLLQAAAAAGTAGGSASSGGGSGALSSKELAVHAQGVLGHPERLLSHKHLQILKTLFNVAHGLGSILGTSWHIVLETFEQLDLVLHVQSAQQSLASRMGGEVESEAESSQQGGSQYEYELDEEEMEAETRMIESMLKNLFETSKFLENEACQHLIIALSQMIFTHLAHASTVAGSISAGASSSGSSTTMAGGSSGLSSMMSSPARNQQSSSGPRKLIESLATSLKTALTSTSSPLPSSSGSNAGLQSFDPDELRFPPFALDKLVETAELNMERIDVIWEVVGSTLLTVASSENSSKIRGFAVKAMEKLVTKVISTQDNPTLRRDVVRKFTELVRSPQADTKDFALQALYRMVSSTGHRLEGLWNLIVAELLIISTTLQSNKQTSALAFKVVQLIMDDYRPSLDVGCLPSLALCLRAFGEQQNDVNMALTSVHHLWLLCEKGDESLEYTEDTPSVPTKESLQKANALWLHVFDQLRGLSLDPRMEVRNSALRSLCTNMVATGDRLTVSSWRICALDIMLPLIDAVDAKAFSANTSTHILGEKLSSHSEVRMTVHHSQDTEEKQWRETRVTALQGTGKVVTSIMQKVDNYRNLDWFQEVWDRTLSCVERTLVTASPARDVTVAAVTVLEEFTLLVGGARGRLKYAVPGMRVVNGALVRAPLSSPPPQGGDGGDQQEDDGPASKKSKGVTPATHVWLWPGILQIYEQLEGYAQPPFDMDVAALVVNIFSELYESKECLVARTQESLKVFLRCCSKWTKHFAKMKNSSKFISPLERNVLKTYSRIPPLDDEEAWVTIVFPQLQDMILDTQVPSKPVAKQLADDPEAQPPSVDEDEFKTKVRIVHADLFAQAPFSVQASSLREALMKNTVLAPQVVHLGLAALPESGFLDDACEDVWMEVLEREKKGDKIISEVLMREGVALLQSNKVPLAVREILLGMMEGETINTKTSFETKAAMLNRFMDILAIGGGGEKHLAQDLLPSLLVCAEDILGLHSDHPGFLPILQRLVELEIDPDVVEEDSRVISEVALSVALDRGYRKPHLVHLMSHLERIAAQGKESAVRSMAAHAMFTVCMDGWRVSNQ